MKKGFILCLTLLAVLFSSLQVSARSAAAPINGNAAAMTGAGNTAENTDRMTIAVDSMSGLCGDTLTVPIRAYSNPGISGFTLSIRYDTNAMELTAAEKGAVTAGGTFYANVNDGTLLWYSENNVSLNGTIAVLTFQLKADLIASTSVAVGLTEENETNLCDENGQAVAAAFLPGTISIGKVAITNLVLTNGMLTYTVKKDKTVQAATGLIAFYSDGRMTACSALITNEGNQSIAVGDSSGYDRCCIFIMDQAQKPLSGRIILK